MILNDREPAGGCVKIRKQENCQSSQVSLLTKSLNFKNRPFLENPALCEQQPGLKASRGWAACLLKDMVIYIGLPLYTLYTEESEAQKVAIENVVLSVVWFLQLQQAVFETVIYL